MVKLFEPIRIKNLNIKNRVIMPCMHTGFAEKQFVSDRLINYYKRRAQTDVGTIIVGPCSINNQSGGLFNTLSLDDDKYIPALTRLTDTLHKYNTTVVAQLYHAGRYALSFIINQQPVSASAIPSKFTKETPRQMTKDEIARTVDDFAQAALRAKKANCDAVEFIGSAGYLINQFLSPLTNKREDEYGGELKNRVRFPIEVITATKQLLGDDYPLFMRVSGDDFVEGSNTIDNVKQIVKYYETAGIALLNVTGGWHETKIPQITLQVPQGCYTYLAYEIKKQVSIPVAACNRINRVELAEKILEQGYADMIAMGRALIADPDLLIKAKDGRLDEIRYCIGCNQGCFDKVFEGQPITCLVNPEVGREGEIKIEKVKEKKKVMVIGAGPSGLEVARILKQRDYEVRIYEKQNRVGGQINYVKEIPGYEEFQLVIDYYKTQLKKLNIDLQLNTEVTEEIIKKENPDIVIIATGAQPISTFDNKNLPTAFDVINKKVKVGKKVIIIGGGGVGCDIALYLSKNRSITNDALVFLLRHGAIKKDIIEAQKEDREITIIEMLKVIGKDIGRTTRWVVLKELNDFGVKMLTDSKVKAIKENSVIIQQNGAEKELVADTIILSIGMRKNNQLEDVLNKLNIKYYSIGDCKTIGKAIDAIKTAFEVALMI